LKTPFFFNNYFIALLPLIAKPNIMLHQFLSLIIFLLSFLSISQQSYSQSLSSFVPKGYSILDTIYGDLNLDANPDAILVLKVKGESDTSNADRPLLILQGSGKNQYKLAGRNDHLVFCASCGGAMGDPYQGVAIEKGSFTIMLYGGSSWRWTQNMLFNYNAGSGKYMLHSDTGESFHSSDPNKVKKIKNQKEKWNKVSFEEYSNDLD
jgi:hypothetical protein